MKLVQIGCLGMKITREMKYLMKLQNQGIRRKSWNLNQGKYMHNQEGIERDGVPMSILSIGQADLTAD